MNIEVQKLLEQVMHLPVTDRAAVAEQLLSSLDMPDPRIDECWAKEAEARIDAYELGEMETVSAEDVFSKYDRH
ncbi:MAG: addiction module protein [Gammaproteobacteria bacterium]|nr:addiction module protein [Gammaproteobacteria bacterium]